MGGLANIQAHQASRAQLEPQAGLPCVLRPGVESTPDQQEAVAAAPAEPAACAGGNEPQLVDGLYEALWCGRRFRTFNVADDFNREVLAIEIDLNLPAARAVRVLERIAAWRGYLAQIRMDNGPEFIAAALADWAQQHGVVLDFIEPGRPMQNGFIERFNRSYREAVLDMYVFRTLDEVRERTDAWMADYNEVLPHDALGDLTPVE